MPPAVMRFAGFSSRNDSDSAGHALITRYTRIVTTGTTSASAIAMKMNLAIACRRPAEISIGVTRNGFACVNADAGAGTDKERLCSGRFISDTLSSGGIAIPSALLCDSVMLPPPDALDDQVRRNVHDEHKREQHDPDQEQHPVVVVAPHRLAQLRRDRRRQRPHGVQDAVRDLHG